MRSQHGNALFPFIVKGTPQAVWWYLTRWPLLMLIRPFTAYDHLMLHYHWYKDARRRGLPRSGGFWRQLKTAWRR